MKFGDFDGYEYARNCYVLKKSITMTGSAVVNYPRIPFSHCLEHLNLYHTVAAHTAGTDALTVILTRDQGTIELGDHQYHKDTLISDSGLTASSIIYGYPDQGFGEHWKWEPSKWSLSLTSTNTDIMEVRLYVKRLKDA